MFLLGGFYLDGVYFSKNIQLAFQWFEKAVESGCFIIPNTIGEYYLEGNIV
jgi:hypothetical protein